MTNAHTVVWQGEEFHIAGKLTTTGLSFWIERPRGKIWLNLDQSAPPEIVERVSEFVALTADDPSGLLVDVAMATGWFERTGRRVRHPTREDNEVWRITERCRKALSLPSPAGYSSRIGVPPRHDAAADAAIDAALGAWLRALRAPTVSGGFVVSPDPTSVESDCVTAAYPSTMRAALPAPVTHLVGPGIDHSTAAVTQFALDGRDGAWQSRAFEIGFRSAMIIRFPIVKGRSYHCVLMGTSSFIEPSNAQATLWAAFNSWDQFEQELAQSVGRKLGGNGLTSLACDTLRLMASGLTAAEAGTASGRTERGVRHHLSEAKAKVGGANTTSIIWRARLLGQI